MLNSLGAQVGKGANMKLVVNMMMGTMMTTLAEGLTLAQKADLDQAQLVEVLGLGFMACPLFAMKVLSDCTLHARGISGHMNLLTLTCTAFFAVKVKSGCIVHVSLFLAA